MTVEPQPKLRIGVPARYFLLGTYGNQITLDWAQGDYKVNERFGFRAGKVKTPIGLLNETQDIDSVHLWVLLPQSIYAIANRNSILSHYGGVVYGTVPLGNSLGELEYRAYGGQRVLSSDDAVFQTVRDKGIALPNGATGPMYGGTLRWQTPLRGLMVGASEDSEHTSGAAVLGALNGWLQATHFYQPYLYGIYERNKWMVGGEYTRQALQKTTSFVGGPTIFIPKDQRAWLWRPLQALRSADRRHQLQLFAGPPVARRQRAVPEGLGALGAVQRQSLSLSQGRTTLCRWLGVRLQHLKQ